MSLREKCLILCGGLLLLAMLNGCSSDTPTRSFTAGGAPPATFSISGTITAAAGSAVDLDTNDPLAPFVANDAPADAQQLSNPVALGGYASAVATGVAGDRFASVPDLQDWYRIFLTAGQTVTLTIADHDGDETNAANPDLDLFLLDPTTLLDVQTSQGLGRQESITVLTSGDYYLQVYAFVSGSNYVLTIGQTAAAVPSAALRIEDDFVPGEVIVRFREPVVTAGTITPQALSERNASLGLVPKAGQPGEPMLFRLAPSMSVKTLSMPEIGRRSKGAESAIRQAKRETLDRVKTLRRRADVVSADLNYIRSPQLVPNDPLFSAQWNLAQINLPQAWELTTGDPAVVVAVLDTGVLMNHPDLTGRLCTPADNCPGYDFVADPIVGADGDGIDPDPTDPGGRDLPDGSSSFHGTHTTGIVGAAGNNTLGMAGVDWAALLMPVRVLGAGAGTSYDVMQGVRYAAGLSNDAGTVPGRPAEIINLSLGGGGYSQAEQDLFSQLHASGVFVIAAAGNASSSLPVYPAAYSGVVSVSGVDIDKNLAPY
ncbi:MAG TPA: S8 family serine peptidase, partial [Geothermobacteraceae bacterium]|nr:S8 family serine peptidase [Geothermobacteraceae bacterium]